jgi:hypothetical protein
MLRTTTFSIGLRLARVLLNLIRGFETASRKIRLAAVPVSS